MTGKYTSKRAPCTLWSLTSSHREIDMNQTIEGVSQVSHRRWGGSSWRQNIRRKPTSRWTQQLHSLAQGASQQVAAHHRQGTACRCRKSSTTWIPLCMFFPRHRFGTSLFNNTPVLLFLRLFYQAAPFDLVDSGPPGHGHGGMGTDKATHTRGPLPRGTKTMNLFSCYEKVSTTDWVRKLLASPSRYKTCQVVSISWVKALESPLSHEYIQFVVEETSSGQRSRMIAERHESGDWVFVGWDWASRKAPSDHHRLPLPLMSLTYDDAQLRPQLDSFAKVLASVSARRPGYNLMKEMCWWYAEAVFEAAHAQFGGKLTEWKWSRFRYSFVVRTSLFQRTELAREAAEFERQNAEGMRY